MAAITEENTINSCAFIPNQLLSIPEKCPVLVTNTTTRRLPERKSYYQTCLVRINGRIVRIVLDSAGGRSLIVQDLADRLNLEKFAEYKVNFGGPFGNTSYSTSTEMVLATLESIVSDDVYNMQFSVVPELDSLRMATIPPEAKERLKAKGFDLVDVDEEKINEYPVQVIVGVDFYGDIWKGMETRVTRNLFVRESIFGWVAFGVTSADSKEAFAFINLIRVNPDKPDTKALPSCPDLNKEPDAEKVQEASSSEVPEPENPPVPSLVNLPNLTNGAWNQVTFIAILLIVFMQSSFCIFPLLFNLCAQISIFISYGNMITSANFVIGNSLTHFQNLAFNSGQELTQDYMNNPYAYNQRLVKSEWTDWRSLYPIQLKPLNQNANTHESTFDYSVGDVVQQKNPKQAVIWPTVEQVRPPDGFDIPATTGTANDTISRFVWTSFPLEYPDEPDAAPPDVGHHMRTSPPENVAEFSAPSFHTLMTRHPNVTFQPNQHKVRFSSPPAKAQPFSA